MKMRNVLIGLAAISLMLVPVLGQGADWSPKGSIKLQIGFGAGGSTDMIGRLLAANVEEQTGWNIVVENKPGGGGVAMLSGLMNQKPDGKTLGLCVNVPILLNLVKRGDKLPFKIACSKKLVICWWPIIFQLNISHFEHLFAVFEPKRIGNCC